MFPLQDNILTALSQTFGILLKTFFKLDFRDKDKSSKKKFLGIIISYLFYNSMLSFSYFATYDSFSFVVLGLSTNAFLLAFVVLNDYGNIFFTKNHIDVINSLPVSGRELFLSKFTSAFIFIGVISLTVLIPQAIFLYFYEHSIGMALSFAALDFLFAIFITTFILFLYTLAIMSFAQKANIILYTIQFVFMFFVMYSSSLASRSKGLGKVSVETIAAVHYLPQYLFASGTKNFSYLLLSIGITTASFLLFYFLTANKYFVISENLYKLKSGKRKFGKIPLLSGYNDFICLRFTRNNTQAASYNLIRNQIRNSRTLKLRYVPLMLVPMIFALIGVLMNSKEYLVFHSKSIITEIDILSPSILITLIMCTRLLITNTKTVEENSGDINWLYDTLPLENKADVRTGVLKFVYFSIIIPITLLMFLILCFRVEPMALGVNFVYILAFLFLINSAMAYFEKNLPFSLEASKYDSANRLLEVLLTIILGIVVFVIQIFVFQKIITIIISIIFLFLISIILIKFKQSKI